MRTEEPAKACEYWRGQSHGADVKILWNEGAAEGATYEPEVVWLSPYTTSGVALALCKRDHGAMFLLDQHPVILSSRLHKFCFCLILDCTSS